MTESCQYIVGKNITLKERTQSLFLNNISQNSRNRPHQLVTRTKAVSTEQSVIRALNKTNP